MSKYDMKNHIRTLSKNDLKDLVKTYRIPLDLHPRLPNSGFTMDHLPGNAIGIYTEFLWFSGVRIPFLTFLLSVLKYFKVHISQLVPLGLDKVVSLEVLCRNLNIVPIVTLFRVFQCLCKQEDWFSFSKCRNTEDFCMDDDDLPTDGYDRNDVERLCARLICLCEMREEMSIYDFMTLLSWGDAKVVEESHHLSSSLLERVPSHTTALTAEGAMIPLPNLDEIAASLPDLRLAKKTSARAASTPTPRLGKRLGAPLSVADVSAFGSSHVGTSVYAFTSGRNISLGGVVVSGHAGKFRAKVLRRQVDPLDFLARSALARDVEYDQIPEDDFGTATCGEEFDLTLFPLTPGPYQMSYPYEDVCWKALDQTITPAKLKRTESWLPLDLANRFNVLSALLVSHGSELNSRSTGLVTARNRLQEKFDHVKVVHLKVMDLDGKLERMRKDYDTLVQENKELRSQKDDASDKVKELQTKLTDARVASIGYKDAMDGLREEVTQFVDSSVKSLVRKLLSSDEFHAALARDASLNINYGVKRGLRIGRTDVEFEAAAQKVCNFHVGAKADFDKALVDFPTTPFPFLSKIVAASGETLFKVTQVLPDKHIHLVIPASAVPPIINEDADQVPFEHASDALAASI
ncbi:hypothetical protein Tco_0865576 [Tanacetum coccineum]